jgi:hypothetical protein
MNRKKKIEPLQKVFAEGNVNHLIGSDEMVIYTVVVERDGWYQIIPINPTFEVPEKELTLKEFEEWKGCLSLFPPFKPTTDQ